MIADLQGPWEYRPEEWDDWGIVRAAPDSEGRRWIICQARYPYSTDDELAEHRRNKTDPWEGVARVIAAAPTLLGQLESAQVDLDFLRRAVEASDPQAELLIRITDLWKHNRDAIAKASPDIGDEKRG